MNLAKIHKAVLESSSYNFKPDLHYSGENVSPTKNITPCAIKSSGIM